MELPTRTDGDRFVRPGTFASLASELRSRPENHEVPTLLVSAFDHRTRMLPFIVADRQIVPAGIRAVSAALAVAGFQRQRVVNQAWTPNVRPSAARFGSLPPELLLISTMQIHSASAYRLIRDAHSLGAARPLILVGGPKAIYQPWDFFQFDEDGRTADVVCTGEEFVLLELLNRLSETRHPKETLRDSFERARAAGWLDDIPGLVFAQTDERGRVERLVDTGVQRLVQDFDELPSPVDGYRYLERPHRRRFLDAAPLDAKDVGRYSRISSLLTTRGCKFRCGYCPIPAYNQFSFRTRSPERLVQDIRELRRHFGFRLFFGTDDNFFNDEKIVVETFEALANAEFSKDDIGTTPRFGTEATEFDVHKQMDVLPLCYRGGLRAIWFGIEDMTAGLINKGQTVDKTAEVFRALRANRILPMAMMMHYDGQPLYSKGSLSGIINQVQKLYELGAGSVQVTVLGPASGTKDFDSVMKRGIIFKTIRDLHVEDCYWDGNHVISTGSSRPWKLQRNMLLAYLAFYNPVKFARVLLDSKRKWSDVFLQIWGMVGLVQTAWRLVPWMLKLTRLNESQYTVHRDVPRSQWEIVPPASVLESRSLGSQPSPAPDRAAAGLIEIEPLKPSARYVQQTVGALVPSDELVASGRRSTLDKY